MGKGDKKSKRGKIVIGSYGVNRPKRKKAVEAKIENAKPAAAAEKPQKNTPVKKAPAKKAPAKKPAAKKEE
jgi:ribosomal small subunit protein bTHX